MPATLVLKRNIGTGARQERDALNSSGYVAFTTLDSANVTPGNAPIGRPSDNSTAFSYEARLYLKVTKAPNNKVDNVRFWGDINNPASGVIMYVGTAVASSTPINTYSLKAVNPTTTYTNPTNSILWSDKDLTALNHVSHHLVMQLRVTSVAPVGDLMNDYMIYHYSYDES